MKVLVADDHEIVRKGLRQILENQDSISSVYETSNGKETLKFIFEEKPDMVILDISMPDINGLDILKTVNNKNPHIKILILSMYPEKEYAIRALKNGAYGYLTKNSAAAELKKAINAVLHNKKYVSDDMHDILFDMATNKAEIAKHSSLSDNEFKVFILLAEGKSIQEIADTLFISIKTVSTYKSRILEKMEMKGIADITRYAIMHKLIN